jgi:branched-chain amino acid transport system substrate-binding protein
MKMKLALILLLLLSFSACSQSPEQAQPPEAPQPVDTKVPPTNTPVPTETPEPTVTPTEEPSNTPTPRPTFSPETITIPADEPVKIAYLLWESNPLGEDQVRGVEIAIADFGAEIQGHPVELTGLDSECNEFAGQQGALKLMEDKDILGIVGTSCSIPALKAAPIVFENNRVMISPSTSSPELTTADTHSLGFARTVPNDLVQIEAVGQFAYENLGARKMAVLRWETDRFHQLFSIALCEYFTELGGECVLDHPGFGGSTHVTPIINLLVEAEADAIYILSRGNEATAALLAAAKTTDELKEAPVFLFGEVYFNSGFLEEAGEEAAGSYVSVSSYDIDMGSEPYQAFLTIYKEDYGEDPIGMYHPFAYDAATLLLKAIDQVALPGDDGSLMVDPLAVREAMYNNVKFQGLSGVISCSPLGDCLFTASGKVYQFISGDPTSFNPGPADMPSSNPVLVWP